MAYNQNANISNDAFQNAVQRARELAAKLSQQAGTPNKRPPEDMHGGPEQKKSSSGDPFGAQLAAIRQQVGQAVGVGGSSMRPGQLYLNGIVINGEKTLDMMLPGTKVGYIIGKGGEMIRNLQERADVKMIVYQQTSEATEEEKQLRIIGEPSKVDYAKQLVNDLLTEKEIEAIKLKSKPVKGDSMTNEYGTMRSGLVEVPVPPQYIGLVIGKGGECIKRIQQETGTKIQFDTQKSDAKGNKLCVVSGSHDAVNRAVEMVKEIIDNASQGRKGGKDGDEVRYAVPSHRCGAVIGKGGETIKAIKQQCGCDIELDKNSKNNNSDEKYFIIRGPPDRISYAKQLIDERVNGSGSSGASEGANTPGFTEQQQYWSNYWQSETSQSSNESANQDQNAAAWAAYYAQYYAQNHSQSNGDTSHQSSQQQVPVAQSDQDYSVQWAEYYRAYGMYKEAEMIEQMAKNKGGSEEKSHDGQGNVSYPYPYSNYSSSSSNSSNRK